MDFSDYLACDATQLAQHVARGETTAAELLALALAQHERVHARVNAVCRLMADEARARLARAGQEDDAVRAFADAG